VISKKCKADQGTPPFPFLSLFILLIKNPTPFSYKIATCSPNNIFIWDLAWLSKEKHLF